MLTLFWVSRHNDSVTTTNYFYNSNSDCWFQALDLRHSISEYGVLLPTIDFQFPDFRLRTSNFRLRISDFGFQTFEFAVRSFTSDHWRIIYFRPLTYKFITSGIALLIYDFRLVSLLWTPDIRILFIKCYIRLWGATSTSTNLILESGIDNQNSNRGAAVTEIRAKLPFKITTLLRFNSLNPKSYKHL